MMLATPNRESEQRLSAAEEDYLLAITRSEGPVKTSELARRMSVADPSVTAMISRLAAKGLVNRKSHGPIELTEQGRRTAVQLVRRHRLIELFLTKTLNYSWDEVHDEAHRLEHSVSEKFIVRLDNFLGHPKVDPHGAPIPSDKGSLPTLSRIPLELLTAGQTAVIAEVDDANSDILAYLGKLGLTPGTRVEVLEVAPFDGPITLKYSRRKVSLGRSVCRVVSVDWVSSKRVKALNNSLDE